VALTGKVGWDNKAQLAANPAASPSAATPATQPSRPEADQLVDLAKLRATGALTEEEFQTAKSRVLNAEKRQAEPEAEEKDYFTVVITGYPAAKRGEIARLVKDRTSRPLTLPMAIPDDLEIAAAEDLKSAFEEEGAKVELRRVE
jgi:ribosomal protein L7/L12